MGQEMSNIRFQYLIPSKVDEQYGCTVNTVGTQIVAPDDDYPVKSHPPGYVFDPNRGRVLQEYQLIYIVGGRGIFSNESGSYEVNKGSVILLRPGCWHTYTPIKSAGWSEYFIGFSGDMVARVIEMMFPGKEQIFNVGMHSSLVDLYLQAIETASINKLATQQLLCGIVMHMLGKVNMIVRNQSVLSDHLDQIIEQAKLLMYENVMDNVDFENIAAQLNVSYSWFRKIFRDYTGYPPAKYFIQLKLRRAQHMLANTDTSIKEIAFALGFKSSEHFFSTFKRVTGTTPNNYRRMSSCDHEEHSYEDE